jgi:DNA repair exonuclease SbcCD ATPase subunit
MSTQVLSLEEPAAAEARVLRVDSPHLRGAETAADEPEGASPGPELFEPDDLWDQMRTQGRQLADLLRDRQQELDRREANLHAQAATWEQEARGGRLWLRSQAAEIREGRAVEMEAAPDDHALEPPWQALKRAETLLAEEREQLQDRRKELEKHVAEHQHFAAAERSTLTEERRKAEAELAARRSAVESEVNELEIRRGELGRVQIEVREAQRETLEMRLATEELWSQLTVAVPPATLARSLGRLRQRLSDHYALSHSQLAEQRQELESLRTRLSDHHDRLARRQQELQDWFQQRQTDLQQQSESLAAREEELRRQQAEVRQLKEGWQEERAAYQREIRELLGKSE